MLKVMRQNSLEAWRDRFEADLRGGMDRQQCAAGAEACRDLTETVASPTPPPYNPEQ
jgi:hypothetical protein